MSEQLGNRSTRSVQQRCVALRLERPTPQKGDKFGRLEIISEKWREAEPSGAIQTVVMVRCECGQEKKLRLTSVVTGHTQSCGCWHAKRASETMTQLNDEGKCGTTSHGLSRHRLYGIYNGMLNRCYNEKTEQHYRNYGGRGIGVCEEWRQDFMAFYRWAMENGWERGLTIERKDVNGNYGPDNCCWATMKVQARNRRNNKFLTAWDETKLMVEWVEDPRCKVTYMTLQARLDRGKWSPEEAISTPPLH